MSEGTNNKSFSGSVPLQIRLDPDGRVVAVEGEAAGRLDLDAASGPTLADLVAPPDYDSAERLLDAALRGTPQRGTLLLRGRSGPTCWDVVSVPVLADGRVAGAWWLLWPSALEDRPVVPGSSHIRAAAGELLPSFATRATRDARAQTGFLLRSLPVGILFEDMHRRIVRVNRAFCELFGIPEPDAVIGADCRQAATSVKHLFVDPEGFVSRIEELVRMRQPVLLEELELADGRVLERDYVPLDGPDGPIGHLWRYQDITERKRTERRLQEAESRYRELVEMLPAVVYRASADDAIAPLYVSPQVEPLLGYTVEEWMADPDNWKRHLHPEDAARVQEEIRHAVEQGHDQSLEYRLIARDGRVLWVRDEGRFVRDDSGRPLYVQGLILDITARKEAEAALRRAEARYRLLVEESPVVVYQVPADDIRQTAYVSPQMERLLGYAPDEWLATPRNWARHLHPEDRGWVEAAIEQALASEGRVTREYRMRLKDGRVLWVQDHEVLLFHPYESFDPVVQLVERAPTCFTASPALKPMRRPS